METGASGKSGSPVADHVELVNSIGLEHVIILYPVGEGRSAKEVRLRCNPAMFIPAKVCILNMSHKGNFVLLVGETIFGSLKNYYG